MLVPSARASCLGASHGPGAHVLTVVRVLWLCPSRFQYIRGPFRSVVYDGASFDGDEMFPISPANESTAFGAILNQRGCVLPSCLFAGALRWCRV